LGKPLEPARQVLREDASGAAAPADGGPAEPFAGQDFAGGGMGGAEGAALREGGLADGGAADGGAADGEAAAAALEECVLQNSRQARARARPSARGRLRAFWH
jgi:hypothetical protein